MDTELIDTRGLSGSRDTGDAHTDAVATVGQTLVDHLLRLRLMVRIDTLDERYRLRENGHIALDDTFDHLRNRQFTSAETFPVEVGVDYCGLLYPTIDLEAGIFGAILGMKHN